MTDIPSLPAFNPPSDWEPVFAATEKSSFFGREPSAVARSAFHYLRAYGCDPTRCRALDLGCGEGRDTVFFAQNGLSVVARDIAPSGIAKTRKMLDISGIPDVEIDLAVADVRTYDYPENTFDLAIAANVYQFLSPYDAVSGICKLQASVKPGGIVGVGVFSPAMASWNTDISKFFTATPEQLMEFFPSGRGWILCDRTEYWIRRTDDNTMGSFAFVVYRRPAEST